MAVGPYLSFVFENRDTLLFQIQEMCRVERITDDAKIQDEIDVYGALLPRPGELSATLMIEIADKEQIKPVLDRFMGIDTGQSVWIQVGKEFAVAGEFEAGHSDAEEGKLAAVHFVRFPFPAAAVRAFADAPVFLAVDHPAARARVELSAETKAALVRGSARGEGVSASSVLVASGALLTACGQDDKPAPLGELRARLCFRRPRRPWPPAGDPTKGQQIWLGQCVALPQSRPRQGRADRARRQGRLEGLARGARAPRDVPAGLQAQARDQGDAPAPGPRRGHSRPRRVPALNATKAERTTRSASCAASVRRDSAHTFMISNQM